MGPPQSLGPRYATEDTELAGQQIKKGDMVIPLSKSANRDEQPVYAARGAGYYAQNQSSSRLWTRYPYVLGGAAGPRGGRYCVYHPAEAHAQPAAAASLERQRQLAFTLSSQGLADPARRFLAEEKTYYKDNLDLKSFLLP